MSLKVNFDLILPITLSPLRQVQGPSLQPLRWPQVAKPLWSASPAASCSSASPVSSGGWTRPSASWSGTAWRPTWCSGTTAASTPCSLSPACLRSRRPRSTGIASWPPTTAWCLTMWWTPSPISYLLLRNWTNRATDESFCLHYKAQIASTTLQVQCLVWRLQKKMFQSRMIQNCKCSALTRRCLCRDHDSIFPLK